MTDTVPALSPGGVEVAAPGTSGPPPVPVPSSVTRSGGGRARHLGLLGTAVVLLIAVAVIAAPGLLTHVDPVATSDHVLAGPGGAHWFGTDQLGRDVFSRVVHGARPVLLSSLLGVALAIVAGVSLGVAGAVAPRLLAGLVMRVIDVLLALPVLLLALIVMASVGTGPLSIIIAIGVAFTPGFARVVNTSVRKLRAAEYVQASRVFGSTTLRTSLRHLLPNLATEVVVLGTSGIGWAVLTATTLSFLGMGVHLPDPDWGSDLAAGATYLSTAWWLTTFPGAAITATILVSNFIGDQLAMALDPRGGKRIKQNLRGLPAFGGTGGRTGRPAFRLGPPGDTPATHPPSAGPPPDDAPPGGAATGDSRSAHTPTDTPPASAGPAREERV